MIRVNLLKAEKKAFEDQTPSPEGEAPDKKTKEKAPKRKIKTPPGNLIIVLGIVVLGAWPLPRSGPWTRSGICWPTPRTSSAAFSRSATSSRKSTGKSSIWSRRSPSSPSCG